MSSSTANGKGRRCITGALSGLLDIPLDVFCEVMAHVDPLDLLRLSRLSKRLRATLLSRQFRFVWTAAISNVCLLPPCPEDVSEPLYAALIFDQFCFLCGASRAQWSDYVLRLRLCGRCRKVNIQVGSVILQRERFRGENWQEFLYLLPGELGHEINHALKMIDPTMGLNKKYYAPDVIAFVNRLKAMMQRNLLNEDIEIFVEQCLTQILERHKNALGILLWEYVNRTQKDIDNLHSQASIQASIINKLKAAGYEEADLPSCPGWPNLIKRPKVLTDRIWNNLRPKLEAQIEEERIRKAQAALERHMVVIGLYYQDFIADNVSKGDRTWMPNVYDACHLPSLLSLAARNDALGNVSREDFSTQIDTVLVEVAEYKTKAKQAMTAYIKQYDTDPEVESLSVEETLQLHYVNFNCLKNYTGVCIENLSSSEMHDHWRTVHPNISWFDRIEQKFRYSPCNHMGSLISKTVGIPKNIPRETLDNWVKSGRLYCSCGDPAMPLPNENCWVDLVSHVFCRDSDFKARALDKMDMQMRTRNRDIDIVLKSDHSLESGSDFCVKFLPEGADTSPAWARTTIDATLRAQVEARMAARPEPGAVLLCRICMSCTESSNKDKYVYRKAFRLPDSPEGIIHHLRGWHEKEFQKWDILFDKL